MNAIERHETAFSFNCSLYLTFAHTRAFTGLDALFPLRPVSRSEPPPDLPSPTWPVPPNRQRDYSGGDRFSVIDGNLALPWYPSLPPQDIRPNQINSSAGSNAFGFNNAGAASGGFGSWGAAGTQGGWSNMNQGLAGAQGSLGNTTVLGAGWGTSVAAGAQGGWGKNAAPAVELFALI